MKMTTRPHILFICARNQWRSPTAARIYAKDRRIDVRSAGLSSKSPHQVSQKDIAWADLILVMEPEHKVRLGDTFRKLPPVESLDIPDDYDIMNAELIKLVRNGTELHLKHRFGLEPDAT